MRRPALLLVILVMTASTASAMIYGGTNFGYRGYPDHDCSIFTTKPYRPFSFSSQWEVDQFNNELQEYLDEVQRFVECIEAYSDDANNDIKRIKEKANEAIDEANALVLQANSP